MTMKNFKILVAALLISLQAALCGGGELSTEILKIINQPHQKKCDYAIDIVRAENGTPVYQLNSDVAMVPASNMKLIVTAAAMKHLGPDFEFKTVVGLKDNNLIIIGGGDPLLGDRVTDIRHQRLAGWIFDEIIAALRGQTVREINDIIVDSTIFDDQRSHLSWPPDQLNRWYACEVSGLNYNTNCVDMTVRNNNGQINIEIEPKTAFIKITNQVKPLSSGSGAVGAYRQPGKINEWVVKGKCHRQQGPFPVAVERPAAFFGFLLAERLAKAGISCKGQLLEKACATRANMHILREFKTPLPEVLNRCNKDSLGLAAESLLKMISAQSNISRKNGNWPQGAALLSQYLLDLGVPTVEFKIDDASGLSRENRLSANAITKVLLDLYQSPDWAYYKASLAAGGIDGTIDKYFNEEKYQGRIFGKTGYLNGVKSFSGICSAESGDYVFSILVNGANGKTRPAINAIAKAVIDNGTE